MMGRYIALTATQGSARAQVQREYGSWKIAPGMAIGPKGSIKIPLKRSNNEVLYEGWWPKQPQVRPEVLLTGICLWDASWTLEFAPKSGSSVKRSPALPRERNDAFERIARREWVMEIVVPTEPGMYHQLLINWQVQKARQLEPQRVLYHLPVREYHCYIAGLEGKLGQLPLLHEYLDEFARKVRTAILGAFQPREIEFISPMDKGARTPVESFRLPYLKPDLFGILPKTRVVGVEDLVEVGLSSSAYEETKVGPTPVLAVVLGMPHPYLNKEVIGSEVTVKL